MSLYYWKEALRILKLELHTMPVLKFGITNLMPLSVIFGHLAVFYMKCAVWENLSKQKISTNYIKELKGLNMIQSLIVSLMILLMLSRNVSPIDLTEFQCRNLREYFNYTLLQIIQSALKRLTHKTIYYPPSNYPTIKRNMTCICQNLNMRTLNKNPCRQHKLPSNKNPQYWTNS